MYRPAGVAEVALELAEDCGDRVARERVAALAVEAVDGLDQTQAGHLDEIVERLACALVASRELARQWQEAVNQLGARRDVAVALETFEELALIGAGGRRVRDSRHLIPPFE